MEDLPRNLAKDVKRLSEPRPARRASRWTLLLVDENGRTIRVRGFPILAALGAGLLIGLLVAAGTGFYLWNLAREDNRRLRVALAASAEILRTEAPRSEGAPPARVPAETPTPASAPTVEAEETGNGAPEVSAPESTVSETSEPTAAVASGSGTRADAPPVEVEDVRLSRKGRFEVRFRLRKVAPGSEALSGHVVLVLEMAGGDPPRMAIPEVPLIDGRPAGTETGETFSIQNYRTMRFRAGPGTGGNRVTGATAFVFDDSGELILEAPLADAGE